MVPERRGGFPHGDAPPESLSRKDLPVSFITRSPIAAVIAFVVTTNLMGQSDHPTDQWLTNPVDDRTFETYLEFFAYERSVPLELRITAVDTIDGLIEERLTFERTPGTIVPARTFRPTTADRRGGIVFLHGAGPQGKDSRASVRMGRVMARAGWTVLAIDILYFGERKTELFRTFRAQEKAEKLYNQPSLYLDFAIHTVKDVGRADDLGRRIAPA